MTLSGKTRAVLKLRHENGKTELYLQGKGAGRALSAFVIDRTGKGDIVTLDEHGRGTLSCGGVRAVLLAEGGQVLAGGGFAGDSVAERQASEAFRLRLATKSTASVRPQPVTQQPREEAQPVPQQPQQAWQPPVFSAPEPPPWPGTDRTQAAAAPGSDALKEILEKAQLLFGPLAQQTGATQPAPSAQENTTEILNPFPDAFPGVSWRRVVYPGTSRYYLEGESQDRGGRYVLHAIPGEYAPIPPVQGFRRFLRACDGRGYWIRIRKEGN